MSPRRDDDDRERLSWREIDQRRDGSRHRAPAKTRVPKKQAEVMMANAVQPAARAHIDKDSDGRAVVIVDEEFARTWRRVGIALDRIGLVVEDRDRSQGVYFVHLVDNVEDAGKAKKGMFSGLFSDDKEAKPRAFRVVVRDSGETSVVSVRNDNDQPDDSEQAKDLLSKLESELR